MLDSRIWVGVLSFKSNRTWKPPCVKISSGIFAPSRAFFPPYFIMLLLRYISASLKCPQHKFFSILSTGMKRSNWSTFMLALLSLHLGVLQLYPYYFFSKLVLLCITVAILCAKTAQICPIFSLERIVMTFSLWKPCPIHFLQEVFWYLAGADELHRRPSLCPIWLPLPFVRGVSVKKRDFPLLSYIPVKTLQHFGSRRELSVQLWWRGDVRGSKWALPTNLQSGHVVLADYLFPWIWNGGRSIQLENGFKSCCSLKFPV